jgi:hypothetical protein
MRVRIRSLVALLLFLPLVACGGGGSTPTSPSPAQSFLAGTWRGTMTIQPDPTGAQPGAPVTGAVTFTFEVVPQTNLQSFRTTIRSESAPRSIDCARVSDRKAGRDQWVIAGDSRVEHTNRRCIFARRGQTSEQIRHPSRLLGRRDLQRTRCPFWLCKARRGRRARRPTRRVAQQWHAPDRPFGRRKRGAEFPTRCCIQQRRSAAARPRLRRLRHRAAAKPPTR